ncbi:MarR family winged helix-turn-helix transcriptional regulator [Microbaculum marinisediminis]|uniref:MarR family transcriptional regulator n=1 Tax=Microbaculum marinisediminis TaxID=2931392 RepID=A0AAW5R5J8_9HYPH|nr:MarR family transcriptional regulator [Microbaculum sp. A6E488]MCT8974183.1 MarR family transcriptional regulator [Microbaculum sp. A6E488]
MTDLDTATTPRKSKKARPGNRTADGKEHLRLWVRLLACAHSAEQRVKGRIKERFGINQTAFNLMSQLDRFPDGIRMGELSRRTVVTGSNVTAVIDDLEKRGFVVRSPAPDDRRAIVISLTDEGREAFAEMAPILASWIEEIFAEFSVESQADLVSRLDELKEAMHATLSTSL